MALFIICSCSYFPKNKIENNNFINKKLKGKIRSLKTSYYKAEERFGKAEKSNLIMNDISKYDNSGEEIYHEENILDLNGKNCKCVDQYDTHGNKIGTNCNCEDSSLNFKYVDEINNNNKIIKESLLNFKNGLEEITTYVYDEHGNKTEENSFRNGKQEKHLTYKYDEKANLLESDDYNVEYDNSLLNKSIYQYDNNNNLTKLSSYNADGKLMEQDIYNYSFDKAGNWIKQVTIKNGKANLIAEREIEYYIE
jgi:YD repeat-containing protein